LVVEWASLLGYNVHWPLGHGGTGFKSRALQLVGTCRLIGTYSEIYIF